MTRALTLVADSDVITQLRRLQPERALSWAEAHSIAERQAALLLDLLHIAEPPVPQFVISSLPGVLVEWRQDWPSEATSYDGIIEDVLEDAAAVAEARLLRRITNAVQAGPPLLRIDRSHEDQAQRTRLSR